MLLENYSPRLLRYDPTAKLPRAVRAAAVTQANLNLYK